MLRRESAVRNVTEELMKANEIIRKLQDQLKQEGAYSTDRTSNEYKRPYDQNPKPSIRLNIKVLAFRILSVAKHIIVSNR